jgi:hypothetical protein
MAGFSGSSSKSTSESEGKGKSGKIQEYYALFNVRDNVY